MIQLKVPCPSCGTLTPLQKTWTIKRGKGISKTKWRIYLYKCPKCGRDFRKAKPETEES